MTGTEITYLPTRRGPLLLLTETSRARLQALVEDLKKDEALFEERGFKQDALRVRLEIAPSQKQLDADRKIREKYAGEIKTAKIAFNEPSMGDVDDLRELALKEKDDPHVNLKVRQAAYALLQPKVTENHPSGEDREDVPVKFRPLVEAACYDACFADLSEELVLFMTASHPA
jgi:hypothetical protein